MAEVLRGQGISPALVAQAMTEQRQQALVDVLKRLEDSRADLGSLCFQVQQMLAQEHPGEVECDDPNCNPFSSNTDDYCWKCRQAVLAAHCPNCKYALESSSTEGKQEETPEQLAKKRLR